MVYTYILILEATGVWMQKHAEVVDRFRVNKNQVKMIFVDETLVQIDGTTHRRGYGLHMNMIWICV